MSGLPTPVDLQRVRAMLDSQDRSFAMREDNSWSVSSPDARYVWRLKDSHIFQISARWRGVATTAPMLHDLRRVIQRCNATRTMPKSYMLPLDHNRYGLMAECSILTGRGLTEQQFFDFCETALCSILDFFDEAEAELPNFVTWKAAG